jgi:site-specific DNA-cytosine methylase
MKFKNEVRMNVLSLFDGMSCGRIALERAGYKVNTYYASEIDKYTEQIDGNFKFREYYMGGKHCE